MFFFDAERPRRRRRLPPRGARFRRADDADRARRGSCGARSPTRTPCRSAQFADTSPRGFGLMQRKRGVARLSRTWRRVTRDARACGSSRSAIGARARCSWWRSRPRARSHDNIVAFWRPKQPLQAKSEYSFTYRLHWAPAAPVASDARAASPTRRSGAGAASGTPPVRARLRRRRAEGAARRTLRRASRSARDQGKIQQRGRAAEPEDGGWRISFELSAGGREGCRAARPADGG